MKKIFFAILMVTSIAHISATRPHFPVSKVRRGDIRSINHALYNDTVPSDCSHYPARLAEDIATTALKHAMLLKEEAKEQKQVAPDLTSLDAFPKLSAVTK